MASPVPVLPLVSSTTVWPGEPAFDFGVLDHLPGDAVLLRKPRVEVIQFGEDAAADPARQPRKRDQRGFADGLDGGSEQPVLPGGIIHEASP
jgi:hypothetical protein